MIKLLFAFIFFPLLSFATPQYYFGLNAGKGSALWLEQRQIDNKTVLILGHRSIENKVFETALPSSEYSRVQAEMKTWADSKNQRMAPLPGPGCDDAVYLEAKGEKKFICFDLAKKNTIAKFTAWYKKTVHKTLGMR